VAIVSCDCIATVSKFQCFCSNRESTFVKVEFSFRNERNFW